MSPRTILAHGFIATVAVAVAAAIAAPILATLDLKIYDVMLRRAGTRPTSGRVAIVAIDDRSLSEFGQWPWSRDVIARLVERIRDAGASVIALDMLLAEPDRFGPPSGREGTSATDAALAEALSASPVVLAYAMTFGSDSRPPFACPVQPLDIALVQQGERPPGGDQLFEATGMTCGLPELSRAAGASGYVNAAPDRDGLLRRIPLVMTFDGNVYPSLALASVRRATGRQPSMSLVAARRSRLTLGGRTVPLDERGTLLVRFRGPKKTFPHVPAADVLDGHLAPGALKDRIVFVGATALGAGDVVATPVDTSLAGIEVHATAADTLLQGDFLSTPPSGPAVELLGTVAAGMLAAGLIIVAGLPGGIAICVLLAGTLWLASFAGVTMGGVFLSPIVPMAAVACTAGELTIVKMFYERRRADSEQGRRERAHAFAVHSLTSLVETRDGATGRHARRTQEYCRLLATRLSALPHLRPTLTAEYIDLVARLAPLHDIGKVGVRDAVLQKPGPLSTEERDEMRQHPGLGHDAIATAERLAGTWGPDEEALVRVAKDLVYTHHERWDGLGYPRGLRGEEIPIVGRIMAVVDVYDALIDARSYHGGVTHEEAVEHIRAGRGTHFDPDVVDAFLGVEPEFRRLSDELSARGREPDR